MAYARLSPFGEERADLRAGIIASTVANAHRDPKKRRRPFAPADFMPKFDQTRTRRVRPWQELKAAFAAIAKKPSEGGDV